MHLVINSHQYHSHFADSGRHRLGQYFLLPCLPILSVKHWLVTEATNSSNKKRRFMFVVSDKSLASTYKDTIFLVPIIV